MPTAHECYQAGPSSLKLKSLHEESVHDATGVEFARTTSFFSFHKTNQATRRYRVPTSWGSTVFNNQMTKGTPAAGGNFFEFIINTLGSKQFVVAFLALSCASTHASGVLPNRVKLKKTQIGTFDP